MNDLPKTRHTALCHVVTPYSLTLCLAYIHHYTPASLRRRRATCEGRLPVYHLRRLASWVTMYQAHLVMPPGGAPHSRLRSLRNHPALAAHLALLYGAGFIAVHDAYTVTPAATTWLHASADEQVEQLLQLFPSAQWENAVACLGLQETLTIDYTCYLQQTLARQHKKPATAQPEPVYWAPLDVSEPVWRLCLSTSLPTWLLFDLLQLGEWEPGEPLTCTPLSLVQASRRGYSQRHIRWLLESATQQPLSDQQEKQLAAWLKRGHAYNIRTVQLLSAAQPTQLNEILAQKRWRPYFQQQIGPRHVAIRSDLIPQLRVWLAQRGYCLDELTTGEKPLSGNDMAYHWLGLRILLGLGEIIPLPYPPPYAQLEAIEAQLTPLQQSELESVAQTVLSRLQTAIRGWDAFWPAERTIPTDWLSEIDWAIEREQALGILYQSLAEFKPGYRRIQPLRLEQRGGLSYLHAYCYRTEATLVFRVDRIHAIVRDAEEGNEKGEMRNEQGE